jgi:hemerythrin
MPKAPSHSEVKFIQPLQGIGTFDLEERQQMEFEHNQLARFLHDLRDTCSNLDGEIDCNSCQSESLGSCRGRLPSFIYDLMDICEKHFDHEESLLSTKFHQAESDEYFLAHKQAHEDILRVLKSKLIECKELNQYGQTAQGYRLLYHTVSNLFSEHARLFDDLYASQVDKHTR